jgi:8-oxo-dGTP pyrophosphatase MutT (NUDIX family)
MAPDARDAPVGGFRVSSIDEVHGWAMWSLVRGEFVDPDGERFVRSFVRSPGAVGVVALHEGTDPRVVLVRQYRPALHRMTLELPAGMRDQDGEDALVTAKRELREEVGLEAEVWLRIGRHVSAPGISNSTVELFLCRELRDVPTDPHGPEERHMTIEEHPLSEALTMVTDGRIDDAKTVIGLFAAERSLRGD